MATSVTVFGRYSSRSKVPCFKNTQTKTNTKTTIKKIKLYNIEEDVEDGVGLVWKGIGRYEKNVKFKCI